MLVGYIVSPRHKGFEERRLHSLALSDCSICDDKRCSRSSGFGFLRPTKSSKRDFQTQNGPVLKTGNILVTVKLYIEHCYLMHFYFKINVQHKITYSIQAYIKHLHNCLTLFYSSELIAMLCITLTILRLETK